MKISIYHIITLFSTLGIVVLSSCSSDQDLIPEPKDTFITITDTVIIDNTLRISKESEELYNSSASAILCQEFFIDQEEAALILLAGDSITINTNNSLSFEFGSPPEWMLVVMMTELDSLYLDAYILEDPSPDFFPGQNGIAPFTLDSFKRLSTLIEVNIQYITNKHIVGRFEYYLDSFEDSCDGLFAIEYMTGC